MLVPNRNFSSPEYRYGFNGKEKDNEVKGSGAQYDYGFRIYDPRLGRFLSQDPLFISYPWYTPYQFAGNMPIVAMDLDGLEEYFYWDGLTQSVGSIVLELQSVVIVDKPDLRGYGLFATAEEIHKIKAEMAKQNEAAVRYAEMKFSNEQYKKFQRSQNPASFYLDYFTLIGSIEPFVNNVRNGDYGWATLDVGLAFLDLKAFGAFKKVKFPKYLRTSWVSKVEIPISVYQKGMEHVGTYIERIYKSRNRPSFRKGVVDEVWESAKKADGNVYDLNTGELIEWTKGSTRKGVWDMGHLPEKEWHKLRQEFIDGKKSWKEVLDEYNNPKNYKPEIPSSNRSGKHEGTPRPKNNG